MENKKIININPYDLLREDDTVIDEYYESQGIKKEDRRFGNLTTKQKKELVKAMEEYSYNNFVMDPFINRIDMLRQMIIIDENKKVD